MTYTMCEMSDIHEILEDQIFLLNLMRVALKRHDVCQSNYLLPRDEIQKCKDILLENLFSMHPCQDDEESLIVTMRSLCNCMSLRLHTLPQLREEDKNNSIHTVQDVDKTVADLMHGWTSLSSFDLLCRLRCLVNFLVRYGSLHVLPDGLHSCTIKCVLCQFALPLDERDVIDNNMCTHYVIEKPVSHVSLEQREQGHIMETSFPPLNEEDNEDKNIFTLRELSCLREHRTKLQQLKKMVKDIQNRYKKQMRDMRFIASLKCVSPYLYGLVARYVLFLEQRIYMLHKFSPRSGGMSVHCALQQYGLSDKEMCRDRLMSSLKRVTLSKTNVRAIHEKFEALLLDPVSLHCNSEKLLRISIIAKRYCLSLGMSPKEIVDQFDGRCKMTSQLVGEYNSKDPWEKMFAFVLTICVYNMWLSSIGIGKSFELNLCRPEEKTHQVYSVILLYDFGQIGFLLDDDTKVYEVYEESISLCILHLKCLVNRGLCRHVFQVKDILGESNL